MNDFSPSTELSSKLKLCDPEIGQYVVELQSKISKLFKHNAKLEVENLGLKMRLESLRGEIEECAKLRQNPLEVFNQYPLQDLLAFGEEVKRLLKEKQKIDPK